MRPRVELFARAEQSQVVSRKSGPIQFTPRIPQSTDSRVPRDEIHYVGWRRWHGLRLTDVTCPAARLFSQPKGLLADLHWARRSLRGPTFLLECRKAAAPSK